MPSVLIFDHEKKHIWRRGQAVALCYKPEGRGLEFRMRSLAFSIDLMIPAAQWPWVNSASNRNEHQESSWA
jgi:hypothetical protein